VLPVWQAESGWEDEMRVRKQRKVGGSDAHDGRSGGKPIAIDNAHPTIRCEGVGRTTSFVLEQCALNWR
jgi:hypothetical protein